MAMIPIYPARVKTVSSPHYKWLTGIYGALPFLKYRQHSKLLGLNSEYLYAYPNMMDFIRLTKTIARYYID